EGAWIVGPDDGLILWVPPQLRESLHWPGCRAILGREQVYIDFTHFKYGTSWTDCFAPPRS
ncbi:uncharacterized protein STEHIDRAFT_52180, partial [Stereum hirsutum FP-91666 SS1]|uniref:uncharacterized protein n=1 Tax=Stereum hirsutum (strain FP-91666) TaxID=721885 RepID=UPI000440DBA0